jgi:hypothetical protein
MTDQPLTVVNIRPKVAVFSILAHLEYKPWFALAEYVDNAIQSFQEYEKALQRVDGPNAELKVEIEIDPDAAIITVRDNACGIHPEDFPRAFRPAEIPTNRSGLSEFGMGMKSASCWFAPEWTVRTTALGDDVERLVTFDIEAIVADQIEELSVEERSADVNHHYTVIELRNVRSIPSGRTLGKIRDHLAEIYREFFRKEQLQLVVQGERLHYTEPKILSAPVFDKHNKPRDSQKVYWKKDIEFDLGGGQRVRGFAALRHKMSTSHAGFSLFRRGRVIRGSGEEKYRPHKICGGQGSPTAKRIFGELHLEGFEVSHTKDGFRWEDDDEESFIELLKESLDSNELPLVTQANRYRLDAHKTLLEMPELVDRVLAETAADLEDAAPQVVAQLTSQADPTEQTPSKLEAKNLLGERKFTFKAHGQTWHITIDLSPDPSIRDLFSVAQSVEPNSNTLHLRIGAASDFVQRYVRLDDEEQVKILTSFCAAFGLAEHLSRVARTERLPGRIRKTINKLFAYSRS